jgi:hypothetical protein
MKVNGMTSQPLTLTWTDGRRFCYTLDGYRRTWASTPGQNCLKGLAETGLRAELEHGSHLRTWRLEASDGCDYQNE